MSDPGDYLRQRLLQSHQAVLDAVVRLDAERARAPVNPGWSAQDLLAHLAAAELGHYAVVQRLLAGESLSVPGFDLDAFNNAEVQARRHVSLDELIAEYRANRAATLELLAVIGDDDWDKAGPHPGGFDTTIEGVFRVISLHEKRHLRELQAAL